MRLVQSAVIGANVRTLTGVPDGVADGAAVDATVGAAWLAMHCVHVCNAVGATAVSCVLGRACPGTLAGNRPVKRWPVA